MRDPRVEQFLTRGQYKWKYVQALPITEIDLEESSKNPARLSFKLEQERVDSYILQAIDGTEFPAVTVLNNVDHENEFKWIMGDGMHRTRGLLGAEKTTVAAYVVEEDDAYRRELLYRLMNGMEGHGTPVVGQIFQCIQLHRKYPHITLTQLAKESGIAPHLLTDAWREERANIKAHELGISGFGDIPRAVKIKLLGLTNVPLFIALSSHLIENNIKSAEGAELYRLVKGAPDEASGKRIIEKDQEIRDEEKRRRDAKKGKTSSARATLLVGNIKRLLKRSEDGTAPLHLAVLNDPESVDILCQQGVEWLNSIRRDLAPIIKRRGVTETKSKGKATNGYRPEAR